MVAVPTCSPFSTGAFTLSGTCVLTMMLELSTLVGSITETFSPATSCKVSFCQAYSNGTSASTSPWAAMVILPRFKNAHRNSVAASNISP